MQDFTAYNNKFSENIKYMLGKWLVERSFHMPIPMFTSGYRATRSQRRLDHMEYITVQTDVCEPNQKKDCMGRSAIY